MTVKFQFVTDAGIGAKAIRWFSWSPASHVDLVLPNGQLLGARSDAIGKVPAGVQMRPPNYKPFTSVIRATLEVTSAEAADIYRAAMGQVGKGYDKEGILDFVFHDDDPEPTSADKKWICSELIQWVTLQAGVPILNAKVNARRLTPGDLLKSPLLKY